ncbi:hypothetical protein HEK131_30510 [Streptomyces seoulensis]|nr:hypothetical protein HEK131_30510 [Streptomyces seoulensis]
MFIASGTAWRHSRHKGRKETPSLVHRLKGGVPSRPVQGPDGDAECDGDVAEELPAGAGPASGTGGGTPGAGSGSPDAQDVTKEPIPPQLTLHKDRLTPPTKREPHARA